ncbi:MAG: phage tail sheath family protein, partial [Bryobacteraceae bacterium]
NQGVWKPAAGIDATLVGIGELGTALSTVEIEELNASGVNCLRAFPQHPVVVWGARTLAGTDSVEYQYIPIRRFALFLEASVFEGLQWVVFEPNAAPLWAQIRLAIGDFLGELFRKGAFQGATSNQAYFVQCDEQTTTQADIENGRLNIVIGFAPLRPAEFVIVTIAQLMCTK